MKLELAATATPKGIEIERISGVFSSKSVSTVGTGTTTKKSVRKKYWYVNEIEQDTEGNRTLKIQALNDNLVPSGPKESLEIGDFMADFTPEIEFYQAEVYPRMQQLETTVTRAEGRRDEGALYSAQFDFEEALGVDEQNVRANFGLGLTYMARGEMDKACNIFERVVKLEAAFSRKHKHLFNEFGICLRKSRLIDQAVEYYTRALAFADNDEHLFYNLARAYYERGDMTDCCEYLSQALEINPDFEEAQTFMGHLEKKQGPLHVSHP